MTALMFGFGFFFASISAAFILHANKKYFLRRLRETNESWRAYEQDTVKLYELRGRTDELFRLATIYDQLKTQPNRTTEEQQFLLKIINPLIEQYHNAFTIAIGHSPQFAPNRRQEITQNQSDITAKLQSIYNTHNQTGLLERKDR